MVGIVLISLGILPFVIMRNNQNKRLKGIIAELNNLAVAKGCKISMLDTWNYSAIGIDVNRKMLFYSRLSNNQQKTHVIDLNNYVQAQINHVSRTLKSKNGTDKVTDKLELVLFPKSKPDQEIRLEFYRQNCDLRLTKELKLIQKWDLEINNLTHALLKTG